MDKLQICVSTVLLSFGTCFTWLRKARSKKESKARSMQSMYGAPVQHLISSICCDGIEASSRCLKSATAGQSIGRERSMTEAQMTLLMHT